MKVEEYLQPTFFLDFTEPGGYVGRAVVSGARQPHSPDGGNPESSNEISPQVK